MAKWRPSVEWSFLLYPDDHRLFISIAGLLLDCSIKPPPQPLTETNTRKVGALNWKESNQHTHARTIAPAGREHQRGKQFPEKRRDKGEKKIMSKKSMKKIIKARRCVETEMVESKENGFNYATSTSFQVARRCEIIESWSAAWNLATRLWVGREKRKMRKDF